MSFFYPVLKSEQKARPRTVRSRDIPIESLNRLGCSVCPRDTDKHLVHPKMVPQGAKRPRLYVLFAAPTLSEDENGEWATSKVGRAVLRGMREVTDDDIRIGGVIQCATDTVEVPAHERECCRGRVVADIEQSRPSVILGVGDAPLAWATRLDAYAPRFRGRAVVVKVGTHVCWYYTINYPNWIFRESKYGPSEQEVAFKHDLEQLVARLPDLERYAPSLPEGDPDDGIERVTGEDGQRDIAVLERALADLTLPPRVGLDLETNGLRPWKLEEPLILTAAVGTFERTVAFPLALPDAWPDARCARNARSLFFEWLLWSNIKECHNLAFEMEWLAYEAGPELLRLTEWDDTMSMAHTIDQRGGTKSLEVQTVINYAFNLKAQSPVDPSRPKWWTLYPVKEILRYNGMDTKWANMLSRTLRQLLARDSALVYAHDRKVRLAPTLAITEYMGLPIDLEYAKELQRNLDTEVSRIEDRLSRCPEIIQYEKKYGRFSPTNVDHVTDLLDKVCGRDEIREKDKDGSVRVSTAEENLLLIPAREVPSAHLILEHRGVEKQLSTYVRPITTGKIISQDGRVHSKYSSMTAVTHRLAAEDPQAQNWPKRKHKEVRGVVAARRKRWILAADYGQIEFRVAGMASGDDNLVKYCWTGYDVHGHWAKRIVEEYGEIKDWVVEEFEVDWDEKGMKTLRQEAKNGWVFPSIFGSAVRSRAARFKMPLEVAEYLDREFWDEFPGVKKWQQRTLKFYEKHLYVETLGGLRRMGPMTPNEIINMPIQGTAAEIVTEAMTAISERAVLEDRLDDLHPILNVHDDLTFEPADEALEYTMEVAAYEMCKHRFDFINVPLIVEMSLGERWSDLKEVAVYRSNEVFNMPNPYKE